MNINTVLSFLNILEMKIKFLFNKKLDLDATLLLVLCEMEYIKFKMTVPNNFFGSFLYECDAIFC